MLSGWAIVVCVCFRVQCLQQSRGLSEFLEELVSAAVRMMCRRGSLVHVCVPPFPPVSSLVFSLSDSASLLPPSSLVTLPLHPPSLQHQAPVPTRAPGVSESFFPGLLSSLAAVGWHRVSSFDDATRTVGVECVDGRGRAHTLRLTLPDGFPADKPTAAAFLPQPFEFPCVPLTLVLLRGSVCLWVCVLV